MTETVNIFEFANAAFAGVLSAALMLAAVVATVTTKTVVKTKR